MWINHQFVAVGPLILIFCKNLPKNGLFLLIILASQTFYPNWSIFLHGYIRHIRDIFQLWFLGLISSLLSLVLYHKISGCSDPEAVTVNCALLPEVDRGHHHRTSKYKDTPEMRQYFYLYHWWFALCL